MISYFYNLLIFFFFLAKLFAFSQTGGALWACETPPAKKSKVSIAKGSSETVDAPKLKTHCELDKEEAKNLPVYTPEHSSPLYDQYDKAKKRQRQPKSLPSLSLDDSASAVQAPKTQEVSIDPSSKRIINRLTVGLLKTYDEINKRYYARQSSSRNALQYVYPLCHKKNTTFNLRPGSIRLGSGSFSEVFQADLIQVLINEGSSEASLKQQRRIKKIALKKAKEERFNFIFEQEASLLKILSQLSLEEKVYFPKYYAKVRLKDQTLAIAMEELGHNLYAEIRKSGSLSLEKTISFVQQTIAGLCVLHSHGYCHLDLKPENILVSKEDPNKIKIADLGSFFSLGKKHQYVVSRYYRAPEVTLGLTDIYSEKIDIWSVACIAFELYYGVPLFQVDENEDLFFLITDIFGSYPKSLCADPSRHLLSSRASKRKTYEEKVVIYTKMEKDFLQCLSSVKEPEKVFISYVKEMLTRTKNPIELKKFKIFGPEVSQDEPEMKFLLFIFNLLKLDPKERPSACSLKEDPFFTSL